MIRGRLFVLFVAYLFAARSASADSTERQERTARTACLAGDYAKGVAILSELFVSTHDAAFIYNQGRCFEQNHRYEDAISRFQEYLSVGKKLTRSEKADAQKHIASCKQQLAQSDATVGPSESKDAKERAAKKACLNGEAEKGIKLLTDLYVDTNDPNYIFNQGRCYEQGSLYREAIERFREYLRKAKAATDAERADANKHIADCKAVLDGPKQETSAKVEADPSAAQVTQPAKVSPLVEEPIVQTALGDDSKRGGRGLRAVGVAAAVVGVAALATGVVLNFRHNAIIRDMRTNYDDGTYSTADGYRTGAIIGYAAGGVCMAGGALLYLLGWSDRGTTVAPLAGADHTGLAVKGRF